MNWLKEEDSELWFEENESHTTFLKSIWIWASRPSSKGAKLLFPVIKADKSLGQNTHHYLVKKSQAGLRRILFDKSCLQRIFFK